MIIIITLIHFSRRRRCDQKTVTSYGNFLLFILKKFLQHNPNPKGVNGGLQSWQTKQLDAAVCHVATSLVSHISVNQTAQPTTVQCGRKAAFQVTLDVTHKALPCLHFTFPRSRQKQELPVIYRSKKHTEKQKTRSPGFPQRSDLPLPTTQSKRRAPEAETCPGGGKTPICVYIYPVTVTLFRAFTHAPEQRYPCAQGSFPLISAFLPFTSSLSRLPSPCFPFGLRCLAGPKSRSELLRSD